MKPLFHNFFLPEVFAFTSDRSADFTLPEGHHDLSDEQRDALSSQCDFELPAVANIRQIHGNTIKLATPEFMRDNDELSLADGLVSGEYQLPLAVRTADCLPVFLYDPAHHCIGLTHAGWKGSQRGVVSEAVRLMNGRFRTEPRDLLVAFGPGIKSCCYQVGQEFANYFPREIIRRGNEVYLDLQKVNRNQLIHLGIPEENIYEDEICTCCNDRYYSYRREGKKAGRMISLMMLRKV